MARHSSRLLLKKGLLPATSAPALLQRNSARSHRLSIAFTHRIALLSFPLPTKTLHFGRLLHSDVLSQIPGSKTACVSPGRIAACRVALRIPAKPSTMWCANISQLTHCSNTGYSPDRTLMSLCRHFICIIFPEIQGETESRRLSSTSS